MNRPKQRLIHYSREPLLEVRSVPAGLQPAHFKPTGLWVSVEGDDDWKAWCEDRAFMLDCLTHPHEIVLEDTANILRIRDAKGIDDFSRRYLSDAGGFLSGYRIDWGAVASSFDGIIIAPYIWARRLCGDAPWYYTWDCASGCIWNARAVQRVIPLYGADPVQAHASSEIEGVEP